MKAADFRKLYEPIYEDTGLWSLLISFSNIASIHPLARFIALPTYVHSILFKIPRRVGNGYPRLRHGRLRLRRYCYGFPDLYAFVIGLGYFQTRNSRRCTRRFTDTLPLRNYQGRLLKFHKDSKKKKKKLK